MVISNQQTLNTNTHSIAMMRNATLAQTSRARSIAAANNQCRALVPADMFPKMSPEFKIAYEGLQGAQADPCPHCGNLVTIKAYAGCGAHPMCELCVQNPDIKVRKPNGCCTIRGCNLPVPEQCIPLIALTEARAKAAECLHKMVFALQREEMRDSDPEPAIAAPVVEAEDGDEEEEVNANAKRGKMSAEKSAAMLAKRRKTMADKKEALNAELAAGKQAIADLAEAQTEIAQLKSNVELLQAAIALREAPAEDGTEPDADMVDGALDAMMAIATSGEDGK